MQWQRSGATGWGAHLKVPRSCDQHHERLSQIIDILLQLQACLCDMTYPRALLKDMHNQHPVFGKEAPGRALRGGALRAACKHRRANDARHAE